MSMISTSAKFPTRKTCSSSGSRAYIRAWSLLSQRATLSQRSAWERSPRPQSCCHAFRSCLSCYVRQSPGAICPVTSWRAHCAPYRSSSSTSARLYHFSSSAPQESLMLRMLAVRPASNQASSLRRSSSVSSTRMTRTRKKSSCWPYKRLSFKSPSTSVRWWVPTRSSKTASTSAACSKSESSMIAR